MRRIDIELERQCVSIRFPYEKELVNLVRGLPERWYDGGTRTWYVPLGHLGTVLACLESHHFKLSATLRDYCEKNGHQPSDVTPEQAILTAVPEDTYTVSSLNFAVREALQARFSEEVWIVGELQGYDKGAASGHRACFFDLVERPARESREVARISVVAFEDARRRIDARLATLPDLIRLRDGLVVRMRGRVDLYPQSGRYQLIITDIDPGYTTGEIELNRERIYRELEKAGVHQQNLSLELPLCPLRVGLITSFESDAYNDFVHQLTASGYGFQLSVHHANVQGTHAEQSILRALRYFELHADEFDVLAIVRGGGSRSDLAYFDTEAIGQAICRHPLKVLCGIGHQRDQCLIDLIAVSTKTPTAAASRLVELVEAFENGMADSVARIQREVEQRLTRAKHDLFRVSHRTHHATSSRIHQERSRTHRIASRCITLSRARVTEAGMTESFLARQIHQATISHLNYRAQHLDALVHTMVLPRVASMVKRSQREMQQATRDFVRLLPKVLASHEVQLTGCEQRLQILHPQRVLERGFAIVRNEDGKIVRNPDKVALGQRFEVQLAEGRLIATRLPEDNVPGE